MTRSDVRPPMPSPAPSVLWIVLALGTNARVLDKWRHVGLRSQ